jgi:hypothetical protein
MRSSLSLVYLAVAIVSAVPVAEHEKRQSAEFDYVIVGVRCFHHISRYFAEE